MSCYPPLRDPYEFKVYRPRQQSFAKPIELKKEDPILPIYPSANIRKAPSKPILRERV